MPKGTVAWEVLVDVWYILNISVTSGQSIARGGPLFPVERVACVVLVYVVLDVFVTSGQSITRCGTLLPKVTVEHVVLVYGLPG